MQERLEELFKKCYECANEESTWCRGCTIKEEIDQIQLIQGGENKNGICRKDRCFGGKD